MTARGAGSEARPGVRAGSASHRPRAATPPAGPDAHESPPFSDSLDPLERCAWRSFLASHARIARRLELDLLARSGLPLAEFDVLFQLAAAEGSRLRMNELADRVLLSRAGITRLVDRLVADGLVDRMKCASDARGSFAVLTDLGRNRLEEARPGHLADVRRHFLDAFSRPELEALADLLGRDFAVG